MSIRVLWTILLESMKKNLLIYAKSLKAYIQLKSLVDNRSTHTFTFMHFADAFIQSNLQNIQADIFLSPCVFPGNWTHNLCAANTMLYHWATGTLWFNTHTYMIEISEEILTASVTTFK